MASNETEQWDAFFCTNKPPADYDEQKRHIDEFCSAFADTDERVVLITSGGTTVPLEHNTVRFVDNFSAGTRGSASAEYFLDQGYAVLFLFRSTSLQPFVRRFKPGELLSYLQFAPGDNNCIQVRADAASKVRPVLEGYQRATAEGSGRRLLQPEHKIHSDAGPLQLRLHLVPKMLKPLICCWNPVAYVVSFKLETDDNILLDKARRALANYKHKLVIGNELHSRKHRVVFVTSEDHEVINLSPQQVAAGIEIEQIIVEKLLQYHMEHIHKSSARRSSTDLTVSTTGASISGSSTEA
ncbi:phosphopantothenate--cysteine ligase isoform X2 [Dermacentor albipictus]|uniref:phosphopantothenate--cysteine ligase isoform X2 n=1 Tax=Dermacentor albipictus TaxID=60249 RepID=UPI0031FE1ED7